MAKAAEQAAAGEGQRAPVVRKVASLGLWTLLALAILGLLAVAESAPAFAQSCLFDEQCQTAMCTNSGNCSLTNLPDTTQCNDGNPCTTIDHCVSGKCTGTAPAPVNTSCDDGNPCITNKKCNASGQCAGTALPDDTQCFYPGLACPGKCTTIPVVGSHICVLCPGADLCSAGICNFSTGQCEGPFDFCDTGCQTGDCTIEHTQFGDLPTCTNQQDKPNNTACDDFDSCTTNDSCQNGECTGTGFSGPAPTSTPFFTPPTAAGTSTPTPTRTATVPPPTATATQPAPTATRTATVPPPTATKTTALPSATATSPAATPTMTSGTQATLTPTVGTPGPGCIGDCDHNSKVSASELVQGINIILGKADLSSCSMGFPGRTALTVVDAGQAVAAALGSCAENPVAR